MRLTNIPRPTSISLYEETRKEVARKYSMIPTVKAVVEFGMIPFPGISDMDSYIIADPNEHVPCPAFDTYTPDQQYALMHKHFAISSRVYPNIHYCDPWLMRTEVVVGEEKKYAMPQSPFSEEERIDMSLHFITTHGLIVFLTLLAEGCLEGHLDVREFLESNKYVEYHYRELKRAKVVSEDATDSSIPTYQNLRKEWFNLQKEDQQKGTESAFTQWRSSVRKLLLIVSNHMKSISSSIPTPADIASRGNHPLLRKFPKSFILDLGSTTYVYQEGREEILLRSDTMHLAGRSYSKMIFVLPLPLAALANMHLLGSGPVADYYRRHAASDLVTLPVYDKPVLRRLVDVIRMNLEDTRHMENVKQPFALYGLSLSGKKANWKVRIGRLEGKFIDFLRRSPVRSLLERQKECVL